MSAALANKEGGGQDSDGSNPELNASVLDMV